MHELKTEFQVLMARLDSLLLILESQNSVAAEHLIPALREQASKTERILNDAIHDFRLFDDVGEEDLEEPPLKVRMEVEPAAEVVEEEDEEDEEDEEEGEEEEEEEENDEGDSNSNTET